MLILVLSCLFLCVGCGEKKKENQAQTHQEQPAKEPQQLWARKFFDGYRTNSFDKQKEITVNIIENFPERLPPEMPSKQAFVWMDVEFVKIDSDPIDQYFNHTDARDYIRENGGGKLIKDAKEKWVSFVVTDKNSDSFSHCLSSKDDNAFVNTVLNLKRGDKLRLGGRVGKINTEVRWFLIDSIHRF